MRNYININDNWTFTIKGVEEQVNVPHTWNALDGQDGGNDYFRGVGVYTKNFAKPEFDPKKEEVFLEFLGVNSSATVRLNGMEKTVHHGGYSTFRVNITNEIQATNHLEVRVDNKVNDCVYPQKADFTFYGGIYRDVNLVIVNKNHFELEYYGAPGIRVVPKVSGTSGQIDITTYTVPLNGQMVCYTILDAEGNEVGKKDCAFSENVTAVNGDMNRCGNASDEGKSIGFVYRNSCAQTVMEIEHVHLWDGVKDPYLYTLVATLMVDGVACDEISTRFGVRTFSVDPQKGFFLNGRSYPLHGVSRHQDFKAIGNAISPEHHVRDMELIKEMGCNTVRLAHYQHDQQFYDLCDEAGMVVWAEIPYISEHMPNGRENTIEQMRELIIQNFNHPSIVTWGLSNEITISTKDTKDMLENHHILNDLCHEMDPDRVTTLACYAMCNPFSKVVHISDIVSYNLYLGWYVPGLFLNDVFLDLFHKRYPKRCLGYSEYGAEAMPNLHSERPRRGDHTEDYQAIYHEYMIKCFAKRPWMWATHVWNMFDFAADARDQGGEPGMNHKGLVTFDRQIKKDSFYLYKCYWNEEPMIHICNKRFEERKPKQIEVKVYSNQPEVSLYVNGELVETQKADHVFKFRVNLKDGDNAVEARCQLPSGSQSDFLVDNARFIRKDDARSYKLEKKKSTSANWV